MNSVLRSCAFTLLSIVLPLLAAPATNWTDRKEYDLVLTIRSETTPQKRLDLLDSWSKNYPKTELREARLELYLETYESLGDPAHMFETSKQILADHPSSPVGLYWCTVLLPQLTNPSPENIDVGDKAARKLITGLNTYFSGEKKPASTPDADWQKQKGAVEVLAHRTLGWAAWQRGELAPAEDEFTKCLEKDPHDTEVSSWLGIVLALENGKQVPALWHLARASKTDEAGTLSEEQRRQVNAMLEHVYASYHGGLDGLDDLKNASASNVFPASGFSIDPAIVVAARRAEAELSLTNPELAAWLSIRRQLQAPDGDKYFAANLQSKALPPLLGTVIRCTPPRSPREFVLSMNDPASPDVILRLSSSLPKYAGPGAKLSFRGTADSFTSEPFGLVVLADPNQVEISSGKSAK